MSWKEYELTSRGFFESKTQSQQHDYEVARLISYHTIAPYMKRRKTIKEFLPFEWEKRQVTFPSKEEIEYMSKKMGKYTDNKGNYWN